MSAQAFHRFDNAKRRRPEHHARQAMLTPPYVLEPLRSLLCGIELDPCTEPDNPTKADVFYCPPQDGCTAVATTVPPKRIILLTVPCTVIFACPTPS